MRAALWLLALFAVAVAVALFAGNNQGTVTLYWPPYRVDLSLNLVLLLLALAFVTLHLALRALSGLLHIPVQAKRWRLLYKERAMHVALLDALSHLVAGRFVRARKAAELVVTLEESLRSSEEHTAHGVRLRTMSHLIAAESAHALQDRGRREQHFQSALEMTRPSHAQDSRDGVLMRAARWSFDDRDANAALDWLDQLPQGTARRTIALRLRLKAARLAGQSRAALDAVRLLTKHRAFSEVAGAGIARGLALEILRAAHDPVQLQRAWEGLDLAERHMPEVALEAAERCLSLGGDVALSRQWVLPLWATMDERLEGLSLPLRVRLVRLLERGFAQDSGAPDAAWLQRIESLQLANPGDPLLQYLAGMMCARLALWGKAQQMLRQSLGMLKDSALKRDAWLALAKMAEQRQDGSAAAQAYREAAKA
ncbi:heme biosynthesis HemY N-terminal domain-containing protein [uncultured Rhodoferax sp.]|uniref:heme biosynthesis protein HemY n=1 Tax=uncultured Rhodoferax sp. TaxID=223188 RepID=UPI0025E52F78|nr:heme biosynthesis HemY N-terminal domain-containing protein [uncultured Rhodoferax sp.]